MLYSEATGQKMPLSATTPYAGSLVKQGGKLYQQASYQDGQAHAYASNIPTLGGIAAGTYPTPGSPNTSGGSGATYLSLNISGGDAANFMTGQFVTLSSLPTRRWRRSIRATAARSNRQICSYPD